MCGRVRLSSDYSEIKIRLKFDLDAQAPNFEPDWNKPPTAPMLVAIRSVDGKRIPKMMKWGLIPRWAKDEKIQYSTHNARSEEFRIKPAFRDAWKRGQRCLVVNEKRYFLRAGIHSGPGQERLGPRGATRGDRPFR
jgi:putative SOS response-associated peptidase YedK